MIRIAPEPLRADAFAEFGDVIETAGARHFPINQGTTIRFDALAEVETGTDGRAVISIFRGVCRPMPLRIRMLERHPFGTQAFMPLADRDWLTVVATGPSVENLRCFRVRGDQGVQYHRNIWHHPLLVLAPSQDFLVVDRTGPGTNLEEARLAETAEIRLSA
ncbi:MAG: ureidoglycolate lyase [Pseudomonadota bacterium]